MNLVALWIPLTVQVRSGDSAFVDKEALSALLLDKADQSSKKVNEPHLLAESWGTLPLLLQVPQKSAWVSREKRLRLTPKETSLWPQRAETADHVG